MHISIDHISVFHLSGGSSYIIVNNCLDSFKVDFLSGIVRMNTITGQVIISFARIVKGIDCICHWNSIMLTDALNSSHFLRILTLRGFQNRDDRAIWVLSSDSSDDRFVVRGEAICSIILTITDNCQIIIYIII